MALRCVLLLPLLWLTASAAFEGRGSFNGSNNPTATTRTQIFSGPYGRHHAFLSEGRAFGGHSSSLHHQGRRHGLPSLLFLSSSSSLEKEGQIEQQEHETIEIPDVVESPPLRQVYPALIEFSREYGHPNIPLGSRDGRLCQTLRLLHSQDKLSDGEVELLSSMNFRWESLEDAYDTLPFDELYARLERYASENGGATSPPKKYGPDPALGAWVACLRRRGKSRIDPDHASRLDNLNFDWTSSPKKCGSAFMTQYREILERVEEAGGDASKEAGIWRDASVQKFVRSAQEMARRETLSEARTHYMTQLLSDTWLDWKPPK